MDVTAFRNSGELSDITIKVEDETFNLHKFPLFVRSNYFKNLPSLKETSGIPKVELEKFPGGASAFSTVADYCYNKEIKVNEENAVQLLNASDYLDMHDKGGKSGLAQKAEQAIQDQLHSSKIRRDYVVPLKLLEQAAEYPELAEKSKLQTKIIDAFTENLATSAGSAAASSYYEPSYSYDRSSPSKKSSSSGAPQLNSEQLYTLDNIPLEWMNHLVRSGAKNGVNNAVLTNIIQNYIDYNTNMNPAYDPKSAGVQEKPSNLITMAADILKVDRKLADIGLASEKAPRPAEKPLNLISIMGDIIKKEGDSELEKLEGSDSDSDEEGGKKADKTAAQNLISIMGDVLGKEKDKADAAEEGEAKKPKKQIKAKESVDAGDKAKILATLTNAMAESKIEPEFSLPWLLNYSDALDNLEDADADVKSSMNKWAWTALRNNKGDLDNLDSIPPAALVKLVQEVVAKDEGKTPNADTLKAIALTERYLADLNDQNKLEPDTFIKLTQVIPKEKRQSFDNLGQTLVKFLDKHHEKINPETQKEMIELIDFSKVNETTLEACRNSKQIPLEKINEAALALCAKLRKELDDAKLLLKSREVRASPPLAPSSYAASSYAPGGPSYHHQSSSSSYHHHYPQSNSFGHGYGSSSAADAILNSSSASATTGTAAPLASAFPTSYSNSYLNKHTPYSSGANRPYSSAGSSYNNYANSSSNAKATSSNYYPKSSAAAKPDPCESILKNKSIPITHDAPLSRNRSSSPYHNNSNHNNNRVRYADYDDCASQAAAVIMNNCDNSDDSDGGGIATQVEVTTDGNDCYDSSSTSFNYKFSSYTKIC